MVIKKEEAKHLLALLQNRSRGVDVSKLNDEGVEKLEAAGLIYSPTPSKLSLTYGGEMVARALESAINKEKVKNITDWDDRFRWVGSEILAMLKNAQKSSNVSEMTSEPLKERGFVEKFHDKERKVDVWRLSQEGEEVLKAFYIVEPDIVVDNESAHLILTSPLGPTEASHMPFDETQKELLEAMRIVAYSIPKGDMATFTGIGRGVRKVLENGAIANEGAVIDTLIMDLVADVFDGNKITDEAKVQLEMMGYINEDLTLLPAGEALMELRALLKNPHDERLFSFALTQEMVETLLLINELDAAESEEIRKHMVDKKIEQFKKMVQKYGRRLNEMPLKKRELLKSFMEAKEHAKWFEKKFDINEYLHSLEAFDLIESTVDEKGKDIYRLTNEGQKVAKEQSDEVREISSEAVKSIKLHRRAFDVPNREWIEKGRKEKLLGEYGPGSRGEFYASLSDEIERKPFMTKYEMELFKRIPSRGETVRKLLSEIEDEYEQHMLLAALDMLEARGFIEILADGHIVETDAGELMDRALSGAPNSLATPVTPEIYRVVKAVAKVGTLYEKEKKIRIMPKQHKEVIKESALSPEKFKKVWKVAKEAKFLGQNGVNEAGIELLKAVEKMNR